MRKINPDCKPGPSPVEGQVRDRTIITKVTEDYFQRVEKYLKENPGTKSDLMRDSVDNIMKSKGF